MRKKKCNERVAYVCTRFFNGLKFEMFAPPKIEIVSNKVFVDYID